VTVYINQPDALDRMGIVEGERWKTHQCGDPEGPCSFNAFLRQWTELHEWARQEGMDDEELKAISITIDGNGAIYGEGGWHRYAVRGDGEIIFLAAFCEDPKHYRPLVEKACFTVWDGWKDRRG
jgi:hypothetical protein